MTNTDQKETFDAWLKEHRGLIFKVVRAYTTTLFNHDDLFQEIVIQIWNSVPSFKNASAVTTWIYRISLNTAIKWTSRKKVPTMEDLESVEHVLYTADIEVDERLVWLYEEIHRLDPVDRSLTLLLLDQFTYKEMANILGISESNVGVKINRIKKLLIAKSKKTRLWNSMT